MQTVHAYKQLTHKWAPGWSHLERDKFVATVLLTAPKVVARSDEMDEGATFVQCLRAPSGTNMQDLKQALRDTLGGSNCKHEYDCCGCATRHVRVAQLGSRQLAVTTRVTYNY